MKKYNKIRKLGKGFFGAVNLYTDIEANEIYAIKEILVEDLSEEQAEKLKGEALLLKEIDSTYVVKCYDSFIEKKKLYIVQQYCPYGNLREFLNKEKSKNTPFTEEIIWEIFLKLCIGLAAFHNNKIIHRNLKPENILMFDENLPKIGDIGFSTEIFPKNNSPSSSGNSLYQPPELFEGHPYTEKGDIWALGCILYELCTFQPPFPSIKNLLNEDPENIPGSYSSRLQNLILQILQKNPSERLDLPKLFSIKYITKKLINLNLFRDAVQTFPELNHNYSIKTISSRSTSSSLNPKGTNFSKLNLIKAVKSSCEVLSLCFLENGKLVSVSGCQITIYKIKSYESDITIQTIRDCSFIFSVCGLRNGNLASAGEDNAIKIWETYRGGYEKIYTLKGHSYRVLKVIELEDGRLCSCSTDSTVKIWDNERNYRCVQTLTGHTDEVECVIDINDYIISVGNIYDCTVRIWNNSTYECVEIIPNIYCSWMNGISKIKENSVILGGEGELFIIDTLYLNYKTFINNELGRIHSICELRNGKVLLGNHKGMIIIFDSFLEKIISSQKVHNDKITCIIEDIDNQLFSSSFDNAINIYN